MSGTFLGILHFSQFRRHVIQKTGIFLQQIFVKTIFAQLILKLQILENLLLRTIFEIMFHDKYIFKVSTIKLHICVEPAKLPVGPTVTNERGECCAPFTIKNISELHFQLIFDVWVIFGIFAFFTIWASCRTKNRDIPLANIHQIHIRTAHSEASNT